MSHDAFLLPFKIYQTTLEHIIKGVQFPVFEGLMLFQSRIALNAYLNCSTSELLFQPHRRRILLNRSSKWSCENLYVKMYPNGTTGCLSRCWLNSAIERKLTVNPHIAVLHGLLRRSLPQESLSSKMKFASDNASFCHVSRLLFVTGFFAPVSQGFLQLSISKAMSILHMNLTVP